MKASFLNQQPLTWIYYLILVLKDIEYLDGFTFPELNFSKKVAVVFWSYQRTFFL
jgi:hypothetical protein